MTEIDNSCQRAFAQLLKTCAIAVPTKGTKKAKRTGQMSGYNCFTSTLYAAEKKKAIKEKKSPMAYSQLLKMKTWSTLDDKQKLHWNGLAKQGCPDVQKEFIKEV